jgi:2-polyprenyl-3-methyl-5-hydroxy-6-metoxy-1,4-benzoquinol methylase
MTATARQTAANEAVTQASPLSERSARILQGLDVAHGAGIEIGALVWPIVRKYQGNITYVDHADTPALKAKYANDQGVPLDMIVEVDAVWGARTLTEAVGRDRRFDYVIASHVVEHVPDLVGWLAELAEVLRESGEIRLVVPDKRFTFDHLRRNTQVAEVLVAHLVKARVPQPQQILDFLVNFAPLDAQAVWDGKVESAAPSLNPSALDGWLAVAEDSRRGSYHDMHCWVFTPASLGKLFEQLVSLGLLKCACSMFHDTLPGTYEFVIGLRPCLNPDTARASWQDMAAAAAPNIGDPTVAALAAQEKAAAEQLQAEKDQAAAFAEAARQRESLLTSQLQTAEARRTALEQSTSWRITRPLRAVSRLFGAA